MKLAKKIIILSSIIALSLAGLIAIGFIFNIVKTTNFLGKFCFTLVTISVSGFVALNALLLLEKKFNVFAVISIALIYLCALSILFIIWSGKLHWNLFTKTVIVASSTSLMFNFIVTSAIRLNKKYMPLQIATYVFMGLFDILLGALIYKKAHGVITFMVCDAIIAVVLMFITSILSKRLYDPSEEVVSKDYIKISVSEYNEMKQKIEELENKLSKYESNE